MQSGTHVKFKHCKMRSPRLIRSQSVAGIGKSGKGATDAVALDQEPEGVTRKANLVLRKRVLRCYIR